MLEIMQSAKNRLDDRDEWRREKDATFREKHVDPAPQHRYEKKSDREERDSQAAEEQRKMAEGLEAFQK
jgi:hypothetical protein